MFKSSEKNESEIEEFKKKSGESSTLLSLVEDTPPSCSPNFENNIKKIINQDPDVITTFPPSNKIHTLYNYDTEFSADSVEWCPHAPFQNFFVCANYYLITEKSSTGKSVNKRKGRILLFSIDPKNGLVLQQILETDAVLDQKWCHIKLIDDILLGVVTGNGCLQIYKFSTETKQLLLIYCYTIKSPEESDCLLLSLDWSTGKTESLEPCIVCSDSNGQIHKFKLENGGLTLVRSWPAHQFEAWIAAYYYWDTNIIFSGGDDSLFLKFDERVGYTPVAKNKTHQAGVTCIHANSDKEYVIATGSYDSYLRLWDIRKFKCPKDELEMPGTLWRIKWDPFAKELMLVACMLGGVHIVSTVSDKFKITESYYEHKNIAYGADWCYLNEEAVKEYEYAGCRIIASCSFYDHLLCVSRVCPDCNCKFICNC